MNTLNIKLNNYISRFGIYIAFLILIIILAIISPTFLTVVNLLNVVRQASIMGVVAVGATFVIITSGIDLSVGSVLALGAVIACSFSTTTMHFPLVVAVLMGLAASTLCGLVNGIIIAKWNVAPFIVTLAMMTIARGGALVYTNGKPVINLTKEYTVIGGGYILGIPIPIYIFIVVILLGLFLLNFTKFGRYVMAIGGNENAAIVSGVNVSGIKLIVYSLSGFFAGVAGIVLSSRIMTGQPVLGVGYELDAIAAVVIGGTSLAGGIGSIQGTLVGILLIGVMNNGLDLMNVTSYYQQVVKGIIILLAVLLDRKNH